MPIRSAITRIRRSRHRASLSDRVLLNWCMSARSIAGSVFAGKWSGRQATALTPAAYDAAIGYIRASEIWEVILTGGDPLMLSPRRLAEIMADLAGIDHVRIIRIHTRVPVAEPSASAPRWLRHSGSTARSPGWRCTPTTPGIDRNAAPPAPP